MGGMGWIGRFLPILPILPFLPYLPSSVVGLLLVASFAGFGGRGRFIDRLTPFQNGSTLRSISWRPCDQVFEDRLVPLQAGVGDQLHPVAARGFVRRFGDAVPDRHVRLPRHEVRALRVGARALDRLVDQHAVREIELEVLLIEIEAVALVAIVGALR